MSLDIRLEVKLPVAVFSSGITHNLTKMAKEAGIYQHLWRPEELGIQMAHELVHPLRDALLLLKADPERFRKLEPENKWGTYDNLVDFMERYLVACQENPEATVRTDR